MSPSNPRPDKAAGWGSLHWIAILAILVLGGLLAWRARSPAVSVGGDEATYQVLSESVAQFRYHDEHLAGAPRHAKYPPGNPAWIAVVRRLAGPDLEYLRAANLILLAVVSLLIADGVRRVGGPWPGVGALALVALSPPLHGIFGTGMSEPPFIFLTTLSLWAALPSRPGAPRARAVIASAAAIAAFLTRTAGLATLGATGLAFAAAGRWRAAGVHGAVALTVVAAWFGYAVTASADVAGSTYAEDLSHLGEAGGARAGRGVGFVIQVLGNARAYFEALPWTLGLPTFGDSALAIGGWLIVILGVGGLGLRAMSRRWPAGAGFLMLAALILAVWPWYVARLALPLLPPLAAAIALGSAAVADRLGRRLWPAIGIAVAIGAALTGWSSYTRHQRFAQCPRQDPWLSASCYPEPHRSFVEAARAIGAMQPSSSVVATAKPATLHYYGRVSTTSLADLVGAERASGVLDLPAAGTGLILLGNLHPTERDEAAPMLQRHCREIEVRLRVSTTTLVLGRRGPPLPGADACAALTEYRLAADR